MNFGFLLIVFYIEAKLVQHFVCKSFKSCVKGDTSPKVTSKLLRERHRRRKVLISIRLSTVAVESEFSKADAINFVVAILLAIN